MLYGLVPEPGVKPVFKLTSWWTWVEYWACPWYGTGNSDGGSTKQVMPCKSQ